MKKLTILLAAVISSAMVFATQDNKQYLVIDLSGGVSADSYPVSYLSEIPVGGWTDEYKTTKLVLRRIEPGTCVVTVDEPYYAGVFEVTQKQWELVMGTNPAYNASHPKCPIEQVSFNTFRGSDVGEDSFIGKLCAKTSLHIDLPTEKMWEYACRAGSTTDYSCGDEINGDYMWYWDNSDESTHEVGTKLPNLFGLYDMHGNVNEWCLDFYDETSQLPNYRAVRGGGWGGGPGKSNDRYAGNPGFEYTTHGFRLFVSQLSEPEPKPDGGPYTEVVDGATWTFTVEGGKATITDIDSSSSCVSIPSALGGCQVVSIWCENLFDMSDNSVTQTISIPNTVTNISGFAFYKWSALTSLTISESVTTIYGDAFRYCYELKDVTFLGTKCNLKYGEYGGGPFESSHCDLVFHVPANWELRSNVLCGYMVERAGEEPGGSGVTSANLTVTNAVVHYIVNSVQPEKVIPATYDTGFVNIITEVKSSGAVAVPATWIVNYPSFTSKFGANFTKALMALTDKTDGAGNPMCVWQDYVAGTDPTDPNDVFKASVTIVEGKPVISYTPELDDTEKAMRKYTTWGKKSLLDIDWAEVPEGKEAEYNFFKVTVEMK